MKKVRIHEDRSRFVEDIVIGSEVQFKYRTNTESDFQDISIPIGLEYDVGKEVRSIEGLAQETLDATTNYQTHISEKEYSINKMTKSIGAKTKKVVNVGAGVVASIATVLGFNLALGINPIDFVAAPIDTQASVYGAEAVSGGLGGVIGYFGTRFATQDTNYNEVRGVGKLINLAARASYGFQGRKLERKMKNAQQVLAHAGVEYDNKLKE